MVEINDEEFFNLMQDWKKKQVSAVRRSNLLQQYIEEKSISQRQLAIELEMSYSTLHDWISMRQITNKRNTRVNHSNELDYLIDRIIFLLSKDSNKPDKSIKRLGELQNLLDGLRMRLEK